VADGVKVKIFMKNFGEFYNDQIEAAGTIILSRTQKLSQEKLENAVALLREKNGDAAIITTPWDELDGKTILTAIEKVSMAEKMMEEMHHHHEHHHHHHDEECDDPHCECHHHHDHDHEHEHHHDHDHHEHHHHDHDEHCCHDHDHEHHDHHHDGECDDPHCCCHDHDHHHHHADEVFTSWGTETVKVYTEKQLETILAALDSGEYGSVLRAKGIVPAEGGKWLHFDYVPEEHEVRFGAADYTGRLCVIGAQLDEGKLAQLFAL